MDKLDGTILINLLAKPIDINLNEICFAVEVAIPNMLHDFTAGNKFRRPKQKQLEEGNLSGCQWDCHFVARGEAAVTVEYKVCVAKLCVAAMEAPANECPHTRKELRQDEGFREIVVGTCIQAFDPLLDQTSRRKHQHGGLYSSLTQLAADFDPAQVGQTHIEKNGVVGNVTSQFERLLTRFRHIHCIGIFPQGARNKAGNLPFVFDQENPHSPAQYTLITRGSADRFKSSPNGIHVRFRTTRLFTVL